MSEQADLINTYVATDTIMAHLQDVNLSENELEIAAKAIQKERAQWVVDNIYAEIGARATALIEKEKSLSDELSVVRSDLELIDGLLKPVRPVPVMAQERVKQYGQQLSYEGERRLMEKQAPFTLPLMQDLHERFSFFEWIEQGIGRQIEETYGMKVAHSLSRAARVVDRVSAYVEHDSESWGAIYEEQDDKQVLRVYEPAKFLGQLYDERNFGHKSLVALLCLIDLQDTTAEK